jgi:hypoxanthine phosphoribosyltransferase
VDIPAEFSLFLSKEQIDTRVRDLAARIQRNFDPDNTILVGILGGAVFFISDLARRLPGAVSLDFLSLSSYFGGVKSTGKVSLNLDVSLDYKDRDILVLDDILDTGRTLEFVKKHLSALQCNSVRCAVLLAKEAHSGSKVSAEFVGFTVPQGFYIGYGLDLAGRYRGLENIYYKNL